MEPPNHSIAHSIKGNECGTADFINRVNDLIYSLAKLEKFVRHLNLKLWNRRKEALDRDLIDLVNSTFRPRKDLIEYNLSMQRIDEIGSAAFVKKLLWSDDFHDWCLATTLDEIIPSLESLVDKYPDLILDEAAILIARVKSIKKHNRK